MPTVDPYKLLQVDPEADVEIIQVAYRKLAQRYHPDVARDPEAARRMAELNAARDLLADPAARAAYDRQRAARHAAPTGPHRPTEPAAGPPPGGPVGSVVTFGRYAGWSLGEIARHDLEYVEWLDRMPIGRPYRAEIEAILRRAGRRGGDARPEEPHGLFRRR